MALNVGNAMAAAVEKTLEESNTAKKANAAKAGVNQLATAIPDAVQGAVGTIEKRLEEQKAAIDEKLKAHTERVQELVRSELRAAGISSVPAPTPTPAEQAGGRRPRKISRRGISKMASRRGSRRMTRRRAGSRKARRASRKAQRK